MSAAERVTRSSFADRIQPISSPGSLPVLPSRIWSDADWERIQLGYHSRDMDEKWDVFTEGGVVFLHRSWTGRGVFEATFTPVDAGGWRISGSVVERDKERYRSRGDEYDCVMLELVISAIVLNEPTQELRSRLVAMTRSASGDTDVPAGLIQHSALRLRSDPASQP
jgi:hypothetical protein